jgi:16S rRNA C1402 (ribose-2'-O) methylase RsmI
MCRADINKKIFLHQTALVGSILNSLKKDKMKELPNRYNYPIFFEKKYISEVTFDSIEDVVTVRCVVPVKEMGTEWHSKLKGPLDKIAWLKEHMGE